MIAPDFQSFGFQSVGFQSIAQVAASRALNTLLEGLALAGLTWAVLRCCGARCSMTRFVVWFSTLLAIAGLPLLTSTGSSSVPSNFRTPELTLSSAWAVGLFTAWAVIAGVLLVRLALSLCHVHRLRRQCRDVDTSSHPVWAELLQEFSRTRPFRSAKLLISVDVRVPSALGFFQPAVVLPAWTLRELSDDELKVIVLHELAHLRRWDDWTNLAQKFVKALFFFHPAVWWIDSHLSLEREIACDDIVIEQTANSKTYAASLVSVAEKVIAEKMRMGRALALAQSALGRVQEISLRLARIVENRPRTNHGWRPALAVLSGLAVVTVLSVPYAPELISFRDNAPSISSTASNVVSSVHARVIPATLKQTASGTAKPSAQTAVIPGKAESRPTVISAKATIHKANRAPKLVMTNAPAQTTPARTLLVLRSTQFEPSGSAVWTLSVWRITATNGDEAQQTFQQVIVMNVI